MEKKSFLNDKKEKINMSKSDYIKEAYQKSYNDELSKLAKVSIDDIEDHAGFYLTDDKEDIARNLIKEEVGKRFGARHPILTGIPTLGIWPAISKGNVINQVTSRMARKDPEFRSSLNKANQDRRQQLIEDAKIEIERDKANQFSNAVAASVLPILAAKSE